jgi:Na+-driven multidrug efflux pump
LPCVHPVLIAEVGAIINLFGYYAIGLPAAALFAFPAGLGIEGLWLGLVLSIFVQVFPFRNFLNLIVFWVCYCVAPTKLA